MIGVRAYRKRPVLVNAAQCDGHPKCARDIVEWIVAGGGTAFVLEQSLPKGHAIAVRTHDGDRLADAGDWIVYEPVGPEMRFSVLDAETFAATFDRADALAPT